MLSATGSFGSMLGSATLLDDTKDFAEDVTGGKHMKRQAGKNLLGTLLRPFLEPGTLPLLFLAGVILLNVIGNGVFELFKEKMGGGLGAAVAAVAASVILIVLNYFIRKRAAEAPRRLTALSVSPRTGLIVLVSIGRLEEIAATAAIAFHQPALRHVWLITSRKPDSEPPQKPEDAGKPPWQSAWKNAQDLKAKYEGPDSRRKRCSCAQSD